MPSNKKHHGAVELAASTVTLAGKLASGPLGTGLGLAGGAAALLSKVSAAYARRVDEQNDKFLEDLLFTNAPDETVAAAIVAALDDSQRADGASLAIQKALRALHEAMTPAVRPSLAILARQYVTTGAEVDSFFRGTCRMLQELTATEFDALRAMMRAALANLERSPREADVEATFVGQGTHAVWRARPVRELRVEIPPPPPEPEATVELDRELAHRFKVAFETNVLATTPRAGDLLFKRSTFERFARIVICRAS